ncbi:hypothetical protein D3C73_1205580 [compost metagenome]
MQDQHAVVGVLVAFQLEPARAQVAQEFVVVLAAHVQQQVVKRFAGRQAVQRVLARGHAMVVAVGQRIAFAIAGGGAAQRLKSVHAV